MMVRMRSLMWLCAGALAPSVGNSVVTLTQDGNRISPMAFGRCGSITSGGPTATTTTTTTTTTRAGPRCNGKTQTMAIGAGSRAAGGVARMATAAEGAPAGDRSRAAWAEAAAATAAGGLPTFWSSRAVRRRRGLGGLAGAAGAGDSDSDGVMDKKAEFYGNSAPGAVAPEGAEKQDKAAVEYAVAGEWEKSLKLIEAMRDSKFVPSVNAYVATIEACRRANEYDRASALFSEMNEVCLPEDLIKEYAAKHPNAPGVTQTQKVFCLAMMMRQDNIEPFEETYRAIMGLASKEKLWQVSLLLVEHLKRTGLVPGKFVYDEICSVLFKTGHPEMATMVFEDAVKDNVDELNSFSKPKLDLHNHTVSTALAAVRVVLLDMARQPTSRPFHDPAQELLIITGMGNNSKDGEAVIKPRVMELLKDMGLEPSMMRNNEGCIVLQPADLQAYTARAIPA